MVLTKQMKRRILFQTILFSAVFLVIGAAGGYYFAMVETSQKFLTELSK